MRSLPLIAAAALTLLTIASTAPAFADETIGATAAAATAPAPKNIIRINPLQFATGGGGLEYERVLSPHVGLGISGDLQFDNLGGSDGISATGYALELRPMFYLSDVAPTGWYLSPFVAGARIEAGEGFSAYGWFAGAMIGYSWLIGSHLNFEIALGVQYVDLGVAVSTGDGQTHEAGINMILPAGEVGLGFAF
jgi:hypothetical protein